MSAERIYIGVLVYIMLLFSLVFHEFGHAWTALRCGDPTAKFYGRVTLNPVAHADLIGTVLFPLLQIFSGVPLIGWAKPVPVESRNLRNPGRDDVLVSIAGPGFNLILALGAAILARFNMLVLGGVSGGVLATLHEFLGALLPFLWKINIFLAFFNLIPMPPLDGSWLLYHVLPLEVRERYRAFGATWGFLVVLGLVYLGVASAYLNFGYRLVSPIIRMIAGT